MCAVVREAISGIIHTQCQLHLPCTFRGGVGSAVLLENQGYVDIKDPSLMKQYAPPQKKQTNQNKKNTHKKTTKQSLYFTTYHLPAVYQI